MIGGRVFVRGSASRHTVFYLAGLGDRISSLRAFRRAPINSMFCHRGIGANVDVVGAVLGCFWGLLEPSWVPFGVPLDALRGFLGARSAF